MSAQHHAALRALLLASALVGGCDALACGRGTHREADRCVADDVDGATADASTGLDAAGLDAAGLDAEALDAEALDTGLRPDAAPEDAGLEPPRPIFPAEIGHLSFAVRTGGGSFDDTDANVLSLCLTATRCFPMNVADVNDFRRGEIDVYHFDAVGLARSAVDRVELRSTSGTDAWRPTCVEMQWDGEPVYCADGLTTIFGNGAASEVESWRDPAGVHVGCTSCYPDTVTHGPMVGETTAETARLFVRSDATRRIAVRLVDEARPGELALVGVRYPRPEDDFTTSFELTGLAPSHQYQAVVEVDGRLSAAHASFRTPPSAGTHLVQRIGIGSCARLEAQPIFGAITTAHPDLFLFVGDNHYGNTPDLESLWWNYRNALEIPERANLLSQVSTLAIWDDHDYVGNNTNRTSPGRESALRAFGDYWPNPPTGLPSEPGVYFRASRGDVDFFMLDDRYERDLPGTAGAHILGDEQHAWLERELMASTATFRVIASGSIFSPNGDESWALDYPASRARLFDFIRDRRIPGVVLISGDIHRSHLRWIHRSGTGAYDLPEVVASPLANSNSMCPASVEPDAETVACLDTGASFGVLDVDTTLADPRIVARILDETGLELARMEIRRSALE